MADDQQNIEVRVKAIVDQAIADIIKTRKATEDLGRGVENMGRKVDKSSALGIAGMRGLEVVAADLGRNFGITGEAASVFGRVTGSLTQKIGAASVAFGAVGIAAYGAYMIYNHFVERSKKLAEEAKKAAEAKEKLRNEIIRNADAAAEWLSRADKVIAKTREQRDAEYELYKVEFERNKEAMSAGVRALEEKKLELQSQMMDYVVIGNLALEVDNKRTSAQNLEIKQLEKLINLKRQQLKDAKLLTQSQQESLGGKGPKGTPEDYFAATLAAEAAYAQSSIANARARGETVANIQQAELDAFNAATAARLATLQGEDAQREFLALRDMDRQTMMLNHDRETNNLRIQAAQMMTSQLAGAFQTLYMMGGSHARKWFTLWKMAATAEATVKGIQSVVNSYEFGTKLGGPPLGAVMASIAGVAMAAQLAAIQKTQFGGGGAVGTYSANPVTGLPSGGGQGQAPVILNLNVNGQTVGTYDLAAGVLKEIHNNNGSVGGFSVQVERSV